MNASHPNLYATHDLSLSRSRESDPKTDVCLSIDLGLVHRDFALGRQLRRRLISSGPHRVG